MTRQYRIQEGCFTLPDTFADRTVNIFVLKSNERALPNLNISRDELKPGENLTAYIDRQLTLMKKIWVSTGCYHEPLCRREPAVTSSPVNKSLLPIDPGKPRFISVRRGSLSAPEKCWCLR